MVLCAHQCDGYNNRILLQVVLLGRLIAESTWEHSTSLPGSLVSDYERGVLRDVEKQPYHFGGQTISILKSLCKQNTSIEPSSKKIVWRKMLNQATLGMYIV